MRLEGWLFMGLSWAAIIGLFAFCLRRTLRGQGGYSQAPKMEER